MATAEERLRAVMKLACESYRFDACTVAIPCESKPLDPIKFRFIADHVFEFSLDRQGKIRRLRTPRRAEQEDFDDLRAFIAENAKDFLDFQDHLHDHCLNISESTLRAWCAQRLPFLEPGEIPE